MKKLLFLLFITSELFGQQELFHAQNKGLLLDEYPNAAAAYSLRRVNSRYTGPLIRVRKDSTGQLTQDIGTIGEALDTIALKAFAGANSCYVSIWYDQSGNGRNATQTTAANQPRIVNVGAIPRISGKITMSFFGSNYFTIPDFDVSLSSIFAVALTTNNAAVGTVYGKGSTSGLLLREANMQIASSNINYQKIASGGSSTSARAILNNIVYLWTGIYGAVNNLIYSNGVAGTTAALVSGTISSPVINIGAFWDRNSLRYYMQGSISEVIVYDSDRTSLRILIEQNINTYYAIY